MKGVMRRSFGINLKALRLLGLYPPDNHSHLYKSYGCFLLILCLVTDPLLSALYFLKTEDSNIMDAGFNLFLLAVMISFIPKLLPFIINSKKIRKCIFYIESSIPVVLNNKQKQSVEECVRVCRRNSIFFFVCVIIDNVTWSSRPLFSQGRELPMDVWVPFDTTNSVIFCVTYIVIAMGVLYIGITSASIDPLIGGLAYHAAGQIMVLKDNLKFLSSYANLEIAQSTLQNGEKDVLKLKIIYKQLEQCIEHHNAILTFVAEIEECFSLVVFSQFVGSIVIICFCCLQLSRLDLGSINFFLMLVYLCSALIQIYFYCYYGTTLYEESNSLTTAAYIGQWHEYDIKSQKAMVILMGRSNISMTITAGKIFDVSLETFTMILRRSYSLLAVLKNY